MKVFAVLLAMVFAAAGAGDKPAASPILVELFTSEGCSSCPPADAWLEKMDTQPLPGDELVVLSEHVDYWNHDGWNDPYSSAVFTDRQGAYVRALGLSEPYTPQIIVDGTAELRGNDPHVNQIFQRAADDAKVPLRIGPISVEGTTAPILRAHIEADGSSEEHNGDVYVAVALSHVESKVLHGENSGRQLSHVAVVESLKKIGKLEKGKRFSHDFQTKLKPGTDPKNIRLIAFVQEPGPGKVSGAAFERVPAH
jgi:hypothetical protein